MLLPYDIRPDREGWTVFDVTTSRPGFLHEVLLVGFSLEDAEEAANALNALKSHSTPTRAVWCCWIRIEDRRRW